jgi:hypothetical protein
MKIEALHIGMKVRHPQYGEGTVKTIAEHMADVRFDDGVKTVSPEGSDLQPAEAQAEISGLSQPLSIFVRETVQAVLSGLGLEKPDTVVEALAQRWQNGKIVMHPSDPALLAKREDCNASFGPGTSNQGNAVGSVLP